MDFFEPKAFFDLDRFDHADLFDGCLYVWEALGKLGAHLDRVLSTGGIELQCLRQPLPKTLVLWKNRIWEEDFEFLGGNITKGSFRLRIAGQEVHDAVVLYAGSIFWDNSILLGAGTVVEPGALIQGPTIIGAHTEVRQGAYIRGKCLIGNRCVVGHTTEIKGSVMMDDAKAGHFAYIGDSILGNSVNLGAGTKLANLKIKPGTVRVRTGETVLDTGMRKFGAVLGDGVEIGCNAVTNPGTLLGKGSMVLPVCSVPNGYHAPGSILP